VQVNLNTNTTNCGACGTTCSTGPNAQPATCAEGICSALTCLSGFADCNGDAPDGCEVRRAAVGAHAAGQCLQPSFGRPGKGRAPGMLCLDLDQWHVVLLAMVTVLHLCC
jgi:hypothetical protein